MTCPMFRLFGVLLLGTMGGCDLVSTEPQAPYSIGTDYTYTLDRDCAVGAGSCEVPILMGPLRIRVDADTVTSVEAIDPDSGLHPDDLARVDEFGIRLRKVFSISKGQTVRDLVLHPTGGYPLSFKVDYEWVGTSYYTISDVRER